MEEIAVICHYFTSA